MSIMIGKMLMTVVDTAQNQSLPMSGRPQREWAQAKQVPESCLEVGKEESQ